MNLQLYKAIIKVLLEHQHYIAVVNIAAQLAVSAKTIHNYLSEPVFHEMIRPCTVDKKQKLGIKLIGNENQRNELYEKLLLAEYPASRQDYIPALEDEAYILHTLFRLGTPCTIQSLAAALYKSRTGIQGVLKPIAQWLHKHDVFLIKKEHVGIWLQGDEGKIRTAYKELCLQMKIALPAAGESTTVPDRLTRQNYLRLCCFFGRESVDALQQILTLGEVVLNNKFTENDFFELLLKLSICLQRIRIKKLTTIDTTSLKNIHEYLAAQVMRSHIEERFQMKFPDEELYEITRYLLAARKQKNSPVPINEVQINEPLTQQFIRRISQFLQIDLTGDQDLIHNLLLHLKPAIRRIKYGAKTENPLLDKIRHNYTNIYLAVMTSIEELEQEEKIAFDANEIGYLCLHIAAAVNRRENGQYIKTCLICDGGITLSKYLESMLQSHIEELKIIKVCTSSELKHMNPEEFDLLLDETHLIKSEDAKLIQISDLLEPDDIAKIKSWIVGRHVLYFQQTVTGLRDKVLYVHDDLKSKEEVLIKYGHYLQEKGYVKPGYAESMLEREKRASTAMGRYVAVPHGSHTLVLVSSLVIVNLKHTISWDEFNVDLVFVLAANFSNVATNQYFFRRLYSIIKDETLISKIKKSADTQAIQALFLEAPAYVVQGEKNN
ncbi:hypothetical protein P22_3790 [Propionispora sp. 2/2-37]|uniref:BglG family transcription antiterminator n=1 Tax=Propionispora sp. 2/2-37 TaxID=1677858 RepID=UPI0006BB82D6|nr:PRD domain-containing protein [Propionispora sp. 2/2-37]CUH97655.1 hypothetical protein P22_3790 [Propionispora sp. 2/2-37]